MPIQVRKGGVWQQLVGGKVFANGAWRSLVAVQEYAGGAWRVVANFTAPPDPPPGGTPGGGGGGTITVTLSPLSRSSSGSSASQSAGPFTATPSGGLAPYTYSWTIDSHDGIGTFSLASSTSAVNYINVSGLVNQQFADCTIHVRATDSLGTSASSNAVSASFTRIPTGQQSGQ